VSAAKRALEASPDVVVRHLDTFGSPGRFEHKFVLLGGDLDTNEVYGRLDVTVFEDRAHVDWVEVDPEHRRKGVATGLYRRLYEWAAEEGYEVEHGMKTQEGSAMATALAPELEQLKARLMAAPGGA
jgi:GNAT superfamily N-acetyltransferase